MSKPTIRLTAGKRILFLTKDPETIRLQLRGELDLQMKDLRVDDLMDDINTDAMTPAWACFDYRPQALARSAYAGITVDGERLFWDNALIDGNFEVIVSGRRKGVGSSRETAVQAEKYAGIRIAIADGFAPIHARNNINSGVLMAGHDVLAQTPGRGGGPARSLHGRARSRNPAHHPGGRPVRLHAGGGEGRGATAGADDGGPAHDHRREDSPLPHRYRP